MQKKENVFLENNLNLNRLISLEESLFYSSERYIHHTAYVGPDVILGNNVKIGPFSTILGNVFIDDETVIYGNVVIGMPAEDKNTQVPLGSIHIGKRCHIREFVSINASKYTQGKTVIGDDCYIMNFCYVSHDATLENNVTLINNVNLGGHAYIEHHATLMANSAIHQFCKVGAYSALAAFSATNQDIPPFCTMFGLPALFAGLNRIGLVRNDFSSIEINNLKKITKWFFHEKRTIEDIKNESLQFQLNSCPRINQFISFIESSKRGVTRKTIAQ